MPALYASIFSVVMPLILFMAIGAMARRFHFIDQQADKSFTKVLVNVFYPALLFSVISDNDALREGNNLWLPPLFGFGSIIIGYLISYLIGKKIVYPKNENSIQLRTFTFNTGVYNYGYFAIPIAFAIFSKETAGLIAVFNLGVEIAFWSVGMMILTGKNNLRALINTPCIAIILAIIFNITEIEKQVPLFIYDTHIPSIIKETLKALALCTIPSALIAVGALIYDNMRRFPLKAFWKVITFSNAIRLVIFPLIGIGLAALLPINRELKQVLIIQCTMPCATIPLVLTRQYGGDATVSFLILVGTTLAGMAIIPLWISLGISIID